MLTLNKKNTAAVVLASLLTLVACGKKSANNTPGAKPSASNKAPAATKPTVKPAVVTLDTSDPIIGSWQSNCAQEDGTVSPSSGTTYYYHSYLVYLVVEKTKMTESVAYFNTSDCSDINGSVQADKPDYVWDNVVVNQKGSVDSGSYNFTYPTLSQNGQAAQPLNVSDNATISSFADGESFGYSLSFDDEDVTYTRIVN